jgi:prepilin-type N-terminal cleavage/methylation domain-containing protein
MKINNRQKNSGFTLIELMVATSIFIVVMLTSMSSLFILLNAGKNSRALRSAMDNVNFAMESMTRSIRMGTSYYCADTSYSHHYTSTSSDFFSSVCPTGFHTGDEENIVFMPQTPPSPGYPFVEYRRVLRGDNTHTLQRCSGSNSGGSCVDIVSSDIDIQELNFFVKGSSPADKLQASIYIIIKGTITTKDGPISFAIQTMASQRNF